MRDYQKSVTTEQTHGQTDGQTDAGQNDPYVPLCFAGDTKVIPMCRYASQVTQKQSKTTQGNAGRVHVGVGTWEAGLQEDYM